MKFITHKICMKNVSLDQALTAAKAAPKEQSLDDVLAGIKEKQIRTASSQQQVKVAEKAPEAAPVAPVAAKVEKIATKVEVKLAKEEPKKEEPKAVTTTDTSKKEAKDFTNDGEKKPEGETKKETKAAATKTIKVAKSCDFRSWEPQDIVTAWKQHGTVQACVKNVDGLVSDPKLYCGLLSTASSEAAKVVRTATAQKKTVTSSFKKFAKLTEDERKRLKAYFTSVFGAEYAEAMVQDD